MRPTPRCWARRRTWTDKVQLVAAPCHLRQLIAQVREVVRRAVDRLGNVLAVGIVAVGDAAAALAHGRQLTAVLPGVGPCAVGQRIAYGVVGDGLPIERRQQVRPISVAVGIGAACCPDLAVFSAFPTLLVWLFFWGVLVGGVCVFWRPTSVSRDNYSSSSGSRSP